MAGGEREFFVTQEEWRSAIARAKVLDAYRQRPVGQWPYVWGFKRRLLLRWYDYAMGRISADGNKRVRCMLFIFGCTGEIKNPAAYTQLKEQFFSELLDTPVRAEEG